MAEFKSSVATWYLHPAAKSQTEHKEERISLKQGSDPVKSGLFDVSAAHSCHHGNRSLKGSN